MGIIPLALKMLWAEAASHKEFMICVMAAVRIRLLVDFHRLEVQWIAFTSRFTANIYFNMIIDGRRFEDRFKPIIGIYLHPIGL
jgi:hypothetical protein